MLTYLETKPIDPYDHQSLTVLLKKKHCKNLYKLEVKLDSTIQLSFNSSLESFIANLGSKRFTSKTTSKIFYSLVFTKAKTTYNNQR